MNNSLAFRTLILLCNHHLYLVPKHFHPHKRKLPTHEADFLHFLLPSTLKSPNSCVLSLWIYVLWLFHINQIIQYVTFGVWCLSCTYMFKLYSRWNMSALHFSLWLNNRFHCMHLPVCLPSIHWWIFGLFPSCGYSAAVNVCVHVLIWVGVVRSLGIYLGVDCWVIW